MELCCPSGQEITRRKTHIRPAWVKEIVDRYDALGGQCAFG